MTTFQAAVIGCGRIGCAMEADPKRIKPATHAGAFEADPRTRLAALVDVSPAALKEASRLFPKARTFPDARRMLSTVRPDIVSVCTLAHQHRALVEACAGARVRAIVCEKPIAQDPADGEAMIKACRDSGSWLFVNHTRRFDPLLRRAREEVASGAWGDVRQAQCLYTAGLFNTGTHLVDLLRFFLGEIDWAQGTVNPRASAPPGDLNVDGILGFASGAVASLQSLEVKDYAVFDLELLGSRGRLCVTRFGFELRRAPVRPCVDFAGYRELDVDKETREGSSRSLMAPLAEHIVACLEGREKPASTGEDGLAALKVLLALKRSAENGGAKVAVERTEVLA